MSMRMGKKWNRLMNIERLEDRWNPDATFGWETDATGLYFRIDGDQSGQGIADTISLFNDSVTGTVQVVINTTSSDDGTPLDYFLSISGGEIALAQSALGKAFKGFRVNTYDGNDNIGAGSLPFSLQVNAGDGNDNVTGGLLSDTIDGGVGNDTINGNAGSDLITSGPATIGAGQVDNDSVVAGTGNDTVISGAGNDSVNTGSGNDSVVAGDGNDTVDGGTGNDIISGGTGNDSVVAGDGNDTVDGGDGNDIISGGNGSDSILGGNGNDNIDAGDGSDVVDAGDGNDTVLGGTGDDSILGNTGNDSILAGDGNDSVDGGDGNDVLTGDAGADSLVGGNGNDTVNIDPSDVFFSGGPGTDTLNLANTPGTVTPIIDNSAPSGTGNGQGFENYNLPATPNITFAPSNTDIVNNTLPAGVNLNAGDTLSFQNSAVGLTINIGNLPFGLGGGSGVTSVIGTPFNDFITGAASNDFIDGGAGNDVLMGGAGNDTMLGGAGNDAIFGQAGDDSMFGGAGDDTVNGGTGNDFLGIEWNGGVLNAADQFLGLDGVDTLVFQGVPDSDGIPGNGIQPSVPNLAIIFNYIAQQNGADKMDYGAGDNNEIQYI